MDPLSIAPKIDIGTDRVYGCTSLAAQLLWLFSYRRSVTVNRRTQQVTVTTRMLWVWQRVRVIPFSRISRIIFRAQTLPTLSFWRYLSPDASSDSAFFLISIALKDELSGRDADELALFTVWEQQPRAPDLLDKLAGVRQDLYRVGDEASTAIVQTLREYLGVPIASH
jgi:hypothetical protein